MLNMKLYDIHHIRFFVSNAQQASFWYCASFGFRPFAVKRCDDSISIAIRNENVIFVFTTYSKHCDCFRLHIGTHGDSVKDVAFSVDNLENYLNRASCGGVSSFEKLEELEDCYGIVKIATLQTRATDLNHTLVDISDYNGIFLPNYVEYSAFSFLDDLPPIPICSVDHFVECYPVDVIDDLSNWYCERLNLKKTWSADGSVIHAKYSAVKTHLLTNDNGTIRLTLTEPVMNTVFRKKSQIQEYLDYNGGPGVQHIAYGVNDIVRVVEEMMKRGVIFLGIPATYYEDLQNRLAKTRVTVTEDMSKLQKLGILVDFDDDGYLLQIFTKPMQDRPTLFIELIQRQNFQGFGVGNFTALFEAVEREQMSRNTLSECI